jgi:hypothetical protein
MPLPRLISLSSLFFKGMKIKPPFFIFLTAHQVIMGLLISICFLVYTKERRHTNLKEKGDFQGLGLESQPETWGGGEGRDTILASLEAEKLGDDEIPKI